MTASDDHDMLIRIDENTASLKKDINILFEKLEFHERRIQAVENSVGAAKAVATVLGGIAGFLSGLVGAVAGYIGGK